MATVASPTPTPTPKAVRTNFTTTAPQRRPKLQPLASSAGYKALLKARSREQAVLIGEAAAYAARLRQDFPQSHIFLYGSVARGDFNLHSDVDLLIVAALPEHPLARAEILYCYVQGREEPKGLTFGEFDKLTARVKLEYLTGALEL